MKYLLMLLMAVIFISCNRNHVFNENDYLTVYDKAASVKGGPDSLMKQIQYPLSAMNNRIEGTVESKLFINENGGLDTFYITKHVHPLLDDACYNAIKKASYVPAMKDGKPIKSQLIIPLQFSVENNSINNNQQTEPQDDSYTVQASPVDGISGILKRVKLPAGYALNENKGKVNVKAYINETGNVYKAEVLSGMTRPYNDEALKAVKGTKFYPSRKGRTPIKSELVITIKF